MSGGMSEERWIDLESRMAFQERTLGVLDEAVREQDTRLERVETRLVRLIDRIEALLFAGENGEAGGGSEGADR